MTEPPAAAEGFLPAPIALARGLASARPPALSARRLPGLPTLALARPARARNIAMTLSALPWGARWALGVLWGADGAPGPQGPPGRPGAAAPMPEPAARRAADRGAAGQPAVGGPEQRGADRTAPAATAPAAALAPRRERASLTGPSRDATTPIPSPVPASAAAAAGRAAPSQAPTEALPGAAPTGRDPLESPTQAAAMAFVPFAMRLVAQARRASAVATSGPQPLRPRHVPEPGAMWATQALATALGAVRPTATDEAPASGRPQPQASLPGRPASAPPPWMDARGLALPSPSAAPLPELAAPPLMPGRAPMAAAPVAATAPELIFPHLELSAPPRETTGTLATTIRLVAETSDDLRGFVERGLNEVNERVKRLARSDSAPPSAGRADDAAARQLLGRVRAIMEEERFRSGRLR